MPHLNSESTLSIDLKALAANYKTLAGKAQNSACAAVVKADAYGLGAAEVAPALKAAGCKDFFVATVDEAVALRGIIPADNIFLFHGFSKGQEEILKQHDLIPVLNDEYQLALWAACAAKKQEKLAAIIHIDTGMNRLGFPFKNAGKLAENEALKALDIKYVMSHLACASEPDHPLNGEQLEKVRKIKECFPAVPVSFANSGGIFLGAEYHFDLVRPGVAIYGVTPTGADGAEMQPVVNLRARIIQIREVDSAQTVGYGASRKVAAGSLLATIPVGYADGYMCALGNVAHGFIAGKKVPVVGRISMDLIVVEVTDIPSDRLDIGTEIELLGKNITVDEVAKQAGTIGYEILTRLGQRFKRVYEK